MREMATIGLAKERESQAARNMAELSSQSCRWAQLSIGQKPQSLSSTTVGEMPEKQLPAKSS